MVLRRPVRHPSSRSVNEFKNLCNLPVAEIFFTADSPEQYKSGGGKMGKIILVTGAARSGKSTFAEQYVAKYGKNIGYIATAQVLDEEMRFRVALHRKRRPANWTTYEAPFDTHLALKEAGKNCDMVLFDCLTMFLSNILCTMENLESSERNYQVVKEKLDLLIAQAQENEGTTVLVSNEVGSGIVPDNRMAREYRDISGLVNQTVAKVADSVYLVVCGIPVDVKKLKENLL